jgi:hypothetical protein
LRFTRQHTDLESTATIVTKPPRALPRRIRRPTGDRYRDVDDLARYRAQASLPRGRSIVAAVSFGSVADRAPASVPATVLRAGDRLPGRETWRADF